MLNSWGRWRDDVGLGIFGPAQDLAATNQFSIVEMGAAAGLELDDPVLENVCSEIKHIEQGGRRRTNLVQPAVHYLLHFPSRFAQLGQADHAAASLQGMKTAAQRNEWFLPARRGMHHRQILVDGRQYFVGFFEKDSQQFCIEIFVTGIHQPRRFGRWGRGFDGCRWWWGRKIRGKLKTFDVEVRQDFIICLLDPRAGFRRETRDNDFLCRDG